MPAAPSQFIAISPTRNLSAQKAVLNEDQSKRFFSLASYRREKMVKRTNEETNGTEKSFSQPRKIELKKSNALCEHNKRHYYCPRCRGEGTCQHGRNRYFCKQCYGSAICCHMKQRNLCRHCDGSSICQHNKVKYYCRACGGKAFCEHGRQRYSCVECHGEGICEHNKRRHRCKPCGGSSLCSHGLVRAACLRCYRHHQAMRDYGENASAPGSNEPGAVKPPPSFSSVFCRHGRRKDICFQDNCDGASLCIHRRLKYRCKECPRALASSICDHGKQRYLCAACGGNGICRDHGRQQSRCLRCLVRKNLIFSLIDTNGSVDDRNVSPPIRTAKFRMSAQQYYSYVQRVFPRPRSIIAHSRNSTMLFPVTRSSGREPDVGKGSSAQQSFTFSYFQYQHQQCSINNTEKRRARSHESGKKIISSRPPKTSKPVIEDAEWIPGKLQKRQGRGRVKDKTSGRSTWREIDMSLRHLFWFDNSHVHAGGVVQGETDHRHSFGNPVVTLNLHQISKLPSLRRVWFHSVSTPPPFPLHAVWVIFILPLIFIFARRRSFTS